MNLEVLLSGLDDICLNKAHQVWNKVHQLDVQNISFDSRTVRRGDLFVCLTGHLEDGHRYANDAVSSGAAAILAERELPAINTVPVIVVQDTRSALAVVAARFYDHPSRKLKLIGITGTNGKTTSVHLLQHIFNRVGYVSGSIGTMGMQVVNHFERTKNTTPESLEIQRYLNTMVGHGAQYAVIEASSHALAMGRLRHAAFHAAVFTNLTHDHLDYHRTMTEYRNAKKLLFSGLQPAENGRAPFAVLNIDDGSWREFASVTQATVLRYGLSKSADVRASDIQITPSGTSFTITTKDTERAVHWKLPGHHNVYNALAAVCTGLAEDIPLDALISALEDFRGVEGRFDSFLSETGITVIVDYAHTPDALQQLLETARHIVSGQIYCVFGCEGDRDREKRPIMAQIALEHSFYPILTLDHTRNEDPERIFHDMVRVYHQNGVSPSRYAVIADRREAIWTALERARHGDAVVIAGKGHETVQILGNSQRPFNDKQVAMEFFDDRVSSETDAGKSNQQSKQRLLVR
jgi:UDP-N-acetylmuramoyl-L-alanyl-D-glutamate--2,6-diaminopimelate ligase